MCLLVTKSLTEERPLECFSLTFPLFATKHTHACQQSVKSKVHILVWDTTKPGLWTLDWTMDWTLDSIMDLIIGLKFGSAKGKCHLHINQQQSFCL